MGLDSPGNLTTEIIFTRIVWVGPAEGDVIYLHVSIEAFSGLPEWKLVAKTQNMAKAEQKRNVALITGITGQVENMSHWILWLFKHCFVRTRSQSAGNLCSFSDGFGRAVMVTCKFLGCRRQSKLSSSLIQCNNTIQLYLILSFFQSSSVDMTIQQKIYVTEQNCEWWTFSGPYTIIASGEARTRAQCVYSCLTNQPLWMPNYQNGNESNRISRFKLSGTWHIFWI